MIRIKPVKYSKIEKIFGPPGKEVLKDFISKKSPFVFENGQDVLYGHKYIIPAVIEALEEIKDYYGEALIKELGLNSYAGCYNKRKTSSGRWWSVHSWGLAVDFLPKLGPYGRPSAIPYHFVEAFKKRGFIWGGDWKKPYTDGMHFSGIIEGV